MSANLNRRAFLKNTGTTALAGAVASGVPVSIASTNDKTANTTSKYDLDAIYNRVGTDCYKWDSQIEKFGRENLAVPMGVADMDFKGAPCITKALARRIEHENYGYLDIPDSYNDSIIDWNRTRYGLNVESDWLLNANGVNPAILSALRAFAPPGSKVIVQPPTYSAFYGTIKRAQCLSDENPLTLVNGRYEIDFEDLERRCADPLCKAIILCNPQNPTGNCWSLRDQTTVGEICTNHGVIVLSDEIHCDFVNRGHRYVPYASIDDEALVRNSVTFKSTSKSFNLSATKCAYLFSSNPDHITQIRETGHNGSVNTLGIVASQAAYEEGAGWLDEVIAYIDGNMQYAADFITSNVPLIDFVKPQGTYLAWLDTSRLQERIGAEESAIEANKTRDPDTPELVASQMVGRYLLENAGVYLNDGIHYGVGGSGCTRMNLATSRKLVELALNNLASALQKA
ncbi:MAG: aminotransferase class I/II-fold pyridoxal phosphate-dependent enzyme [Pseudomonadales bacterium]